MDTGKIEEREQYSAKLAEHSDKIKAQAEGLKALTGGLKALTGGLRTLRLVQYGILIVSFVGFVGFLWAAFTFFGSTTESYRAELKSIHDQLETRRQTQIDSLKAQVWRLENAAKTQVR